MTKYEVSFTVGRDNRKIEVEAPSESEALRLCYYYNVGARVKRLHVTGVYDKFRDIFHGVSIKGSPVDLLNN